VSAQAVIALEDVVYAWPGHEPCLDIPRFELMPGERVFLHGPSGSGKSTLLNLIGGVLTPRAGRVRVLGRDFSGLGSAVRDRLRAGHIGFIFQQFNLIPYLSALDNVLLPCRFSAQRQERARQGAGSMRAAAERLLTHLDLGHELWRKQATALSVGQQQRVAAARALIGQPELVVADEPTSALDEGRQLAFLELLRAECDAAGAALLFVSHDRRLAEHFQRELALGEINRAMAAA
jgi:putative ABC transport system ATP-binding protein